MESSQDKDHRAQESENTPIEVRLEKVLDSGQCPICSLLQPEEFDTLVTWLGGVSRQEGKTLDDLIRAGGFCNFHFWRFSQISGQVSDAQIAKLLMTTRLQAMRSLGYLGSVELAQYDTDPQVQLLRPAQEACPVCRSLLTKEAFWLQHLARWLQNSAHQAVHLKSRGLCFPHWFRIGPLLEDKAIVKLLYTAMIQQLELLVRELDEFTRKNDPHLRWERTEDEQRAPRRAIEKLVGWFGMPDKTPSP